MSKDEAKSALVDAVLQDRKFILRWEDGERSYFIFARLRRPTNGFFSKHICSWKPLKGDIGHVERELPPETVMELIERHVI
jgi:hypothetical protein